MARQVPDNKLCIDQNTPLFGFISIYGLKSWMFDTSTSAECTDMLQLHKMLRKDSRHNFRSLQVKVPSKLNDEVWAQYLGEYSDWQLPLIMKFRFPLYFDRYTGITSQLISHKRISGSCCP